MNKFQTPDRKSSLKHMKEQTCCSDLENDEEDFEDISNETAEFTEKKDFLQKPYNFFTRTNSIENGSSYYSRNSKLFKHFSMIPMPVSVSRNSKTMNENMSSTILSGRYTNAMKNQFSESYEKSMIQKHPLSKAQFNNRGENERGIEKDLISDGESCSEIQTVRQRGYEDSNEVQDTFIEVNMDNDSEFMEKIIMQHRISILETNRNMNIINNNL
jgi:hypothetical protein